MWGALNRSVFMRCSTMFVAVAATSFVFERVFDVATRSIFESINKGKLWKDVADRFVKTEEEEEGKC